MDRALGNGKFFIFTGTSGSGRKTISKQIAGELDLTPVISYTTRDPKPHEMDGRDYRFIARKQFIEEDIRGDFFQTAEIDNHFYGIKKSDLLAAIQAGANVYVVVNRYAATRFKYEFGDRAVRMFIYVDKQTILERLQARGETDETIDHYMKHYFEEVSYRRECEHVFENWDLKAAVAQVRDAILSYLPARTM